MSKSSLEGFIVAGKFASGSEGICLRQFSKGSCLFAVFGPIDHHRPLGVNPPATVNEEILLWTLTSNVRRKVR